jgi:hypothetical protein
MLWRLSIALFGVVTICAGALSAVTLWVLFSSHPEPRRSGTSAPGWQFEARKGESPGGAGPLNVTGASRHDLGNGPRAPDRPEAKVMNPSIPLSGTSPPAQSDEAGAGQPQPIRKEPQDRSLAARQQDISPTSADLRPRAQCSVALCAARYTSFHAADCTYQPLGGGPRSICELGTRSAEALPQMPGTAIDPRSEAKSQVAEGSDEAPRSAPPAREGAQCNVAQCAASYGSFRVADCTYQPHGGAPRRICER